MARLVCTTVEEDDVSCEACDSDEGKAGHLCEGCDCCQDCCNCTPTDCDCSYCSDWRDGMDEDNRRDD